MKTLDLLTESFKTKYESFLTGCDSIELDDVWDKDANGEMDVFYSNDLICVILSLIMADRNVSDEEVRYLNENFGFSYTVEELKNVYLNCGEEIGHYFETNFKDGYALLKRMNEKLAAAYRELFHLICEIIAASDGMVSDEEKRMIAGLTLE